MRGLRGAGLGAAVAGLAGGAANDTGEVVGVYTPCGRPAATMDGFTWTPQAGFTTVNYPNGAGTTTIQGVNDDGDLVGCYTTDHGKITNGMLATP